MPNVFISYYPFDTLDVVSKLNEAEKLSQLTEKLQYASKNITRAAADMRLAHFVGFFAVPEYYFLKSLTSKPNLRVELYSERERDALLGKLIMLSDRFNHIVILPGTITWRRQAPHAVKGKRNGKDVDLIYEGISSAPVLYSGNLVATYDKVMNDRTIDVGTEDTRFTPGTESPLFKVMNLKCGIEICGDFNEKNLAKAAGGQSLDFEFMMSATNYHHFKDDLDGIPVRNGGYFLHVDQAPGKAKFYNGVWCVNRGAGSHGLVLPPTGVRYYDPWTMKEILQDLYGVGLSSGHAISLSFETSNTSPTSGVRLPGRKAFAGMRLMGSVSVTKALDPDTGQYEVTLKVELMLDSGSTSPKDNRTINFSSTEASVRPKSAQTNAQGEASAVFTCRKDHVSRLTASFHGAKVVAVARMVWVGAGDITKIRQLIALPHSEVPTFLTPV